MNNDYEIVGEADALSFHSLAHALGSEAGTVIGILAAAILLAVAYVLTAPETYTAVATIFPPDKNERGLFTAASSQLPLSDLLSTGDTRTSDIYADILQSRSVAESVVLALDLRKFFGIDESQPIGSVIKEFQHSVSTDVARDGLLTLSVALHTRWLPTNADKENVARLSSEIATAMLRELDKINQHKLSAKAHESREFIGGQLAEARVKLDSVSAVLQKFQETHKTISPDKQFDATLRASIDLGVRLAEKEAALVAAERELLPTADALRQLRNEVSALRAQVANTAAGNGEFFMGSKKAPGVERTYLDLLREFKVREQITLYLEQEYEHERVTEARDVSTIRVLDAPAPPHERSWPRRTFFVMIVAFLAATLASIVALARYRSRRNSLPQPQPLLAPSPSRIRSIDRR